MLRSATKLLLLRLVSCLPSWVTIPVIARHLGETFGEFGAWLGAVTIIGLVAFGSATSASTPYFTLGRQRDDFVALQQTVSRRSWLLAPLAVFLDILAAKCGSLYIGLTTALITASASSLYQIELETARLFRGTSGYGNVLLRRTSLCLVVSIVFPTIVAVDSLESSSVYFALVQLSGVHFSIKRSRAFPRIRRTERHDGYRVGSVWAKSLAVENALGSGNRLVAAACLGPAGSAAYSLSAELSQRYIAVGWQTVTMPLNQTTVSKLRTGTASAPAPHIALALTLCPVFTALTLYFLAGTVIGLIYGTPAPSLPGWAWCLGAMSGGITLNRLRKSLLDPYIVRANRNVMFVMVVQFLIITACGWAIAWLAPSIGLMAISAAFVLGNVVSTLIAWRAASNGVEPTVPAGYNGIGVV